MRTRTDLLKAAHLAFAQHGYHEASIADITELADVGVGTFYLHFRDKDEIFTTLIDEDFREMHEQIAATMVENPQGHTLEALIRAIFRHAYTRRDLFQIAWSARSNGPVRSYRPHEELLSCLTQILETFENEDVLSAYHVPLMARFMTGIITQGIHWWFENDAPGPDEMAEQALSLLRHGLPEEILTRPADL
ncbi:TetR family transcriptional regulator [Reticulibacter mediterranei]|uniref:TetR family transcriptional regulator n=2 Tax=Reticulibacter mediterranei TaxID=2778369 RepID=A0A8J3N4E8_9CHLR|nr:TetR family transcriptional regulator [Reticulibacter mediterranei]